MGGRLITRGLGSRLLVRRGLGATTAGSLDLIDALHVALEANAALLAMLPGGNFTGYAPDGTTAPFVTISDVATEWRYQSTASPIAIRHVQVAIHASRFDDARAIALAWDLAFPPNVSLPLSDGASVMTLLVEGERTIEYVDETFDERREYQHVLEYVAWVDQPNG